MQSYLTLCCSDQYYHYPTSQRKTLRCEDISTLPKVPGRVGGSAGTEIQSLASDSNARAHILDHHVRGFHGCYLSEYLQKQAELGVAIPSS